MLFGGKSTCKVEEPKAGKSVEHVDEPKKADIKKPKRVAKSKPKAKAKAKAKHVLGSVCVSESLFDRSGLQRKTKMHVKIQTEIQLGDMRTWLLVRKSQNWCFTSASPKHHALFCSFSLEVPLACVDSVVVRVSRDGRHARVCLVGRLDFMRLRREGRKPPKIKPWSKAIN